MKGSLVITLIFLSAICYSQPSENSVLTKNSVILTVPTLNLGAFMGRSSTSDNDQISVSGGVESDFMGIWYLLSSKFGISGELGYTVYGMNYPAVDPDPEASVHPLFNPGVHSSPIYSFGATYSLTAQKGYHVIAKASFRHLSRKMRAIERSNWSERTFIENPSFSANRADEFHEFSLEQVSKVNSIRPELQVVWPLRSIIVNCAAWGDFYLPREYIYTNTTISGINPQTSTHKIESPVQATIGLSMSLQIRMVKFSKSKTNS